ncbi:alpha/beta fold hydrolase [Kitasatospora phosalacinea]|uniref:Alpha/beta fold hydrolase n=1 Tax=Kitasatospora phosalacinea TaxID=2065 RepID=A0ABW6GG20_9ACTN
MEQRGSGAGDDLFLERPDGPRIAYRVHGPADGEPLLLVAGLGLDLTSWPTALVDGFADRGFRVVRFDNRDAGCSGRIAAPPPGRVRQLLARPHPDAYTLADMAADALALLDALGVERAHLVGMSTGGMIAQTLAARHPERVATLTSVFSTTGAPGMGHHLAPGVLDRLVDLTTGLARPTVG